MFDHTKMQVFFKDKFVDFKDANISIGNTGFLYGLGIFSGMRANYNEDTKQLFIFRPQDHFDRLKKGAKLCRYNNFLENYDYSKFLETVKELLRINKIEQDVYIRVSIYTDELAIGPKFKDYQDSLIMFLYPLGDYVPTSGMKCKISSWRRISDNAIPARAKFHGAYVNTALAKTEALELGFDEAIVLNQQGKVVEGSAENIFVVRNGRLITPPANNEILEGITRNTVIQITRDEGLEVVERAIGRTELYFADEVFFTGTGAKVSPVTQIDNTKIADGKPGKISTKLQKIYFDAVIGKVENYRDWLELV